MKIFVLPGGHRLWPGTDVDLFVDYQSSCEEEQRDE
jgi:hypothetical protein